MTIDDFKNFMSSLEALDIVARTGMLGELDDFKSFKDPLETLDILVKAGMKDELKKGVEKSIFDNCAKRKEMLEEEGPEKINGARFCFSEALCRLKMGKKVARAGWNGKNMWIFLIMHDDEKFDGLPVNPEIAMKCADGHIQPGWLASQSDLLSCDWYEVD